jgi:hypothetical protein
MDLFPHQNGSLALRIDSGVMVGASGHAKIVLNCGRNARMRDAHCHRPCRAFDRGN